MLPSHMHLALDPRQHMLRWALLILVGVHAIVLSARFIHTQSFDDLFRNSTLDIVLVNARSENEPVHAQSMVQRAAPYGIFNTAMRHDTEQVDIPLVFSFAHRAMLETGAPDDDQDGS